ncbi:uncharacterized protein HD556DRAFT_1304020 [Suillus plorans]|uniref:Uncharacterized protein n=1 Tax=Suillus plorans TaxID=116603 RepID=A0A9P7J4V0_9AGAM|nr:uncharacterized protein HD556DRAFT_1304020 [Suillus plorans]KAG1802745.1 hypothetical protein HD556DRAFT_1304020 [Suillus plorans]
MVVRIYFGSTIICTLWERSSKSGRILCKRMQSSLQSYNIHVSAAALPFLLNFTAGSAKCVYINGSSWETGFLTAPRATLPWMSDLDAALILMSQKLVMHMAIFLLPPTFTKPWQIQMRSRVDVAVPVLFFCGQTIAHLRRPKKLKLHQNEFQVVGMVGQGLLQSRTSLPNLDKRYSTSFMRELHPHFRTLVRLLRQYYARSLVELEISVPQGFSLEYHLSSAHPFPKRFPFPDGLSGTKACSERCLQAILGWDNSHDWSGPSSLMFNKDFPRNLRTRVHAHFRGFRAHLSPSVLPIGSLIEYEYKEEDVLEMDKGEATFF